MPNAGYDPNPGHSGTGTVVATYCATGGPTSGSMAGSWDFTAIAGSGSSRSGGRSYSDARQEPAALPVVTGYQAVMARATTIMREHEKDEQQPEGRS